MEPRFLDRREAGQVLARALKDYANHSDVVVLALPRGGVPVAYEIANALHAPLDVLTVRKLGVPGHEELAMGAVTSGGVYVVNEKLLQDLGVSKQVFAEVLRDELAELNRRESAYRDDRPRPALEGKTVILVDDGLATGASMVAAVAALRRFNPARIVVAVPVCAPESQALLRQTVDEVVCAMTPQQFAAVGAHYVDFGQTSDEEVRALLQAAHEQEKRKWKVA
ncbi:MAG: phosphoribosyltransferase [Vulcanimicrobiaceae bacterium]